MMDSSSSSSEDLQEDGNDAMQEAPLMVSQSQYCKSVRVCGGVCVGVYVCMSVC